MTVSDTSKNTAAATARYRGLIPWKPGQSGNPGGRPVGSRVKLQGDFMRELAEDFAKHGKSAIVEVRENEPAAYLKVVASLMPKEVEEKRALDNVPDEVIEAAIEMLTTLMKAQTADVP